MAKSKLILPSLTFGYTRSKMDLDLVQMQERVNAITNWVSEYDILEPSCVFQHRTAVFSLNQVRVISVASTPTIMKVNDPDCTIAIPIYGNLQTWVGNRHYQYGPPKLAMFTPPGKRHSEGGMKSVILVSVSVKRLMESARVMLGENIGKLDIQTPRLLDTAHGKMNLLAVIHQACLLVDQFQGDIGLLRNFSPDETIVRAVIMMLAPDCFFSGNNIDAAVGHPKKRMLDNLCDYIVGNLDQPFDLTRLELISGMSARMLQLEFKKRYAATPLQWVREQRLIKAHALLRNPQMTTTVSTIAADCGFDNFSDFAKRYAAVFGELPSETLKKAFSRT